jgi:enoyl-CoA hydratase/carnithine racemase
MGASWLLPRVVGLGNASEILLLGDRVTPTLPADRAGERVVADEPTATAVDRAAFELAARVAAGPHFAARMTKTMLQQELDMGFTDAIEAEAQAQTLCMQHPDFKEADRRGSDKRAPRWR